MRNSRQLIDTVSGLRVPWSLRDRLMTMPTRALTTNTFPGWSNLWSPFEPGSFIGYLTSALYASTGVVVRCVAGGVAQRTLPLRRRNSERWHQA